MPEVKPRVEIPFDVFSDITHVDIDNNGQNDLQLAALVESAFPTYYGYRYFGSVGGTNNMTIIGNGGFIKRLANDTVIPATPPVSAGNIVLQSATNSYAAATFLGEWDVNDLGIAGFVFGPAGSKRAGWIQIRTTSFSNGVINRLSSVELVQWAYETVPGVSIKAGQTSSASVPGDYNNNGTVGPEDYTVWKTTFGDTVAVGAGADGNKNGKVDAADYAVWRNNKTAGSGSLLAEIAVPEPATVTLGVLALGAAGVATLRRRSK
jgi:hypothetical protein